MPNFDLIKNVLLSWQVIVITIAFVAYWSLVSAIGRSRTKRVKKAAKPETTKKIKAEKRPGEKQGLKKNIDTSELGLE
ncbi:MAG: hypothetical protein LBV68_05650 [Spirochaetaceae bacterium]|jgi:flagellar biosynthesis/type III secretory pathway M-ring protein FliF/YscJ|nr:hypothetical protein [Spirochaetaceae bacterium]